MHYGVAGEYHFDWVAILTSLSIPLTVRMGYCTCSQTSMHTHEYWTCIHIFITATDSKNAWKCKLSLLTCQRIPLEVGEIILNPEFKEKKEKRMKESVYFYSIKAAFQNQ